MTHETKKIAFIGAGNMAQAIIAGLIKGGWSGQQIMASNPGAAKLEQLASQFKLLTTQDNNQAAEFGDIIVLAVKPQKMAEVCSRLSTCQLNNKLIISVAAGFPTAKISQALASKLAIIRAMPNTPALIGYGATGLFANKNASHNDKLTAESIFRSVGIFCWINNEAKMDVVTAIAGSSPAYFFLMMQAMVEQAIDEGLTEIDAFNLITQTMAGAAMLARATPQKSLKTLREEVTSKGGTTAAAIASFTGNQFEQIIKQAVVASINRGKELGNQQS